MAFYFVSTFANAQTPTKQRPYGYRGLKIFTSLKLRFQDFQRQRTRIDSKNYSWLFNNSSNSGNALSCFRQDL
ncbi:hypothetical protein [Bathymodiolus japonicus methanotrophic gill symbiont]|uniref:hypothetical protein n=1 Tax=Bathymodiolus japonicus methanotrophic gill symbiont TaxID=113269 RepID=UPI001C8E787C|nr:hypothetical protein [Bathymodiolus japonicus methanotrophic gill symbiont]